MSENPIIIRPLSDHDKVNVHNDKVKTKSPPISDPIATALTGIPNLMCDHLGYDLGYA